MLAKRLLLLCLLLFLTSLSAQAQTISIPAIVYFKADTPTMDYAEVEAGIAAANFSWNVVGMTDDYYLRMEAWVNEQWGVVGEKFDAKKSDRIVIAHPQDFGLPTYRLSVVNQQGVIVAASFLQIRYKLPEPNERPHIKDFTAVVSEINAGQLSNNTVFIPIQWSIEQRWPTTNAVFEQVLPGGQIESVELPRQSLWIPSAGKGVISPQAVSDGAVVLQMRLVDVETDETIDTRQITLPVNDTAPLTTAVPKVEAAGHAYPGVSAPAMLTPVPTTAAAQPDIVAYDPHTLGFYFEADTTDLLSNRTVILRWNAPGASQVWVEMHEAGTSGCGKIYHQPSEVYGPLEANYSMSVKLPDDNIYGAWFELYVDHYSPASCSGRVPYLTYTAQAFANIPALKPGEYFTANAPASDIPDTYTVTPGDWAELSWHLDNDGRQFYLQTYSFDDPSHPIIQVESSGTLRVCPRPGLTDYILGLGGFPSDVRNVSVSLMVSDSLDYPANRGEGNPCWAQ